MQRFFGSLLGKLRLLVSFWVLTCLLCSQAFAVNDPATFNFAVFGGSSVSIIGGSSIDSYEGHSCGGEREEYGEHGEHGEHNNGNIGTNSVQGCAIQVNNGAKVYGKALVGYGGNPATGVCVSGGAQLTGGAGALPAVKNMTPKTDPGGGIPMGALTVANGASKTIGSGTYRYSSLAVGGGGTLTLDGQVTIYLDGNLTVNNGASLVVKNGPATLYVKGRKIDFAGGSLINGTQDPKNLTIYGLTGLQTVNLSGGSTQHLQVYAPTAAIVISGGQKTFGSLIGNTIAMSNGASVHFPEITDATAPVISMTSPLSGDWVRTPMLTVAGTLSEPVSSVTVNGSAAQVSGTSFSLAGVQLVEGANPLGFEATDLFGNRGTLAATLNLDTVAPTLAVTAPLPDLLTKNPLLTVTGTLSEDYLAVDVNGAAATVTARSFSKAVTLAEGLNQFSVQATDRAGNAGSASFKITLDSTPPVAPVLSAPVTPTKVVSCTVNGSAEPGSTVRVSRGTTAVGTVTADAAGSFSLGGIGLIEGSNSLSATATDLAGNTSVVSDPVVVVLDTAAPSATVSTPALGAYLKVATVSVAGTVDDPSVTVTVNGRPATVTASAFSLDGVNLVEGSNALRVVVTDPAGNSTTYTVTVILDTRAPQLFVSTLANGAATNNPTLNLTGTATDNTGIAELRVNGDLVPVAPDGSYSYALRLHAGANSVELTATDLAGNQTSDSRSVTLDQNAPVIALSTPADNSKTKLQVIDIIGSLSKEAVVEVKLKDIVTPAVMDGLNFSSSLTLEYGLNTIEITALDPAGNRSSVKRTVVFDDQKPSLAVIEPGQDQRTNQPSITIKGTAGDDLSAVSIVVAVDGQVFTPALVNGAFEQVVSFGPQKSYTIAVTATDEVGLSASVQRNVIYDTTAPALTIAPVTTPTNQAVQLISGTREENALITVSCPSAAIGAVGYPSATSWQCEVSSLGVELNTISVSAADLAGNVSTLATDIVYDTTPPTGSCVINGGAVLAQGTRVVLDLSAWDGHGVNQMQCSNDGTTWSDAEPFAATKAWELVPGDGAKQVLVRFSDLAGNWTGSIGAGILLDTTPPLVGAAPAGGLFRTTQSVTLSANEAAIIYYTTDGSAPSTASAIYGEPILVPASATLQFFATDAAGNSGPLGSENYRIDGVAPLVKIVSPTDGAFLNTPTIAVSGTLDDPSAAVTVNGAPATLVAGGFSLAGVSLNEGSNTLSVVATDPAGNPGSEVVTVNLDTRAPVLTLGAPAPGFLTRSALVTVSGQLSEELVSVTVNGIPATVTGTAFTLPYTLTEGVNILNLEAKDRAGNTGSASVTGTLDSQAPPAPAFGAQPSPTKAGSVTLAGSAEPLATVKILSGATLLGSVSADGQGNFSLANVALGEGANSFSASATDQAGNESAASAPLEIVRDTEVPRLSVSTLADLSYTNNATLNVSGSAQDNVALAELTVNGTACVVQADGGFSFAQALQPGQNLITVVVTDKAGNQTTDSRTVTLDQTAPVISIAAPADNSKTKQQLLEFRGSVDKQASVELKIRDAVQPALMDGFNFSASVSAVYGLNTVEITAVDLAGNRSTVKRTVVFDDKQPSLAVTDPGQDIRTNQGSLTIKGSAGDELSTVSVSIAMDGQNYTPAVVNGSFEQAVSFGAEKSYAVVVTATDEVGLATVVQRNIIYDVTPPAVAINPVLSPTNQASQLVTGTREAEATVTLTSATATVGEVSYPSATTWSATVSAFSADSNELTAVASDATGNLNSATARIIYDITPPTGTIIVNNNGQVTGQAPVELKLNSSDADGVVQMRLSSDGITWSDPAPYSVVLPWSLGTGDGLKQIFVQYLDGAGNWSGSFSTSITLDTTPPVISVATPVAASFLSARELTVSGTVNEPVTSVTVNGAAATLSGLSWSLPYTLSEGLNNFTVDAVDLAGNSATSSVAVTLDTQAPAVLIGAPGAGLLTRNALVTVNGTVSEDATTVLVNSRPAQVSGRNWSLSYDLSEGANTLSVVATDRAGNSGSNSVSVTLDSTAPAVPVLVPPATPTKVASIALSGSAEPNAQVKVFSGTVLLGTVGANAQGEFTLPGVTLAEGANSFSASALDAAGNLSAESLPVTAVLDTRAPVITVVAPEANSFFSIPQATVKGSLDEPVASLTLNGQAVAVGEGGFEQAITLTPGANSITLIATDLAGNSATKTVLVSLDATAPVVTITAPVSGGVTRTAQVTVTGSVNEANTSVTLNGTAAPLTSQAFSASYLLQEGENTLTVEATDRAGNKGSAAVVLTLDTQAPALSLQAPAEAAAGANLDLSLTGSDNNRLTLVELKADGVPIWSGGDGAAVSETVAYRLSPSLNAGSEVLFQARGLDSAGNEGSASARVRITQAAMGPGYLQGKVLDDARGLRLEGASVTITDCKAVATQLVAAADGGYFAETAAGASLVAVSQPGFTSVERLVSVLPEKKATALDARLTRISAAVNLIDLSGGAVRAELGTGTARPALELTLPAGAVSRISDVRLTPLSNQGLPGLLPAGWSPLAAVDLRLLDPASGAPIEGALSAAASLKFPVASTLQTPTDAVLVLASYDPAAHQWQAKGRAALAEDRLSASAEVTGAGQYALVIGDPAPNAPPAAEAGAALVGSSSPSCNFASVTAQGKVVPQAAPPATGLKAAGEVVLTAKDGETPVFTSGLVLNSLITEKFDLKAGDTVETPAYTQDIVLYRYPCLTSIGAGELSVVDAATHLRTTFPVSPSRDYSIVDLLLGKVGLDITVPDAGETAVMVGVDGGRLVDADGNILAIPQGALSQTTPVLSKNGVAASGAVGDDFTLLKVVELNLTRQTLSRGATLSFTAPASLAANLPILVAKQIEVKGVAKLKLVALGKLGGSLISSDTALSGVALPGITSSGTYYFLQAKAPVGFVSGLVTDAGNGGYPGALVKTDTGSLVDLTSATGSYLVAAPVAPVTATALDLYKNDQVSGSGSIASANQVLSLDLKILMIPPTVVSVTPNGVNVQPNTPVVATFSKAIDRNTVSAASFKVTDTSGAVVAGVFTYGVDGRTVSFSPGELLSSERSYTVTLAGSIKDLQGYALGNDVSSGFTVRKTTPPPMPAAGAVSGTFPDADGFITVTGTQGSAEPNDTVLLVNDASGEIVSVTPASNGSFSGKIRAQLGDEIQVVLMDHSGNRTLISYITYKSDDGKYLVTAKGGTVEGEGGSVLDIPEGALLGPAVFKVNAVSEASLAATPVPEKGQYLAAFNIESGGASFQKEVHLSIPVPAGFNPATPVFVTRPNEIYNADGTIEKVYEIVDSTKVINGRITTASPPFDGIMAVGTYVFTAFPQLQLGIVSGYTYQDVNGLSGYQPGPDREADDQPIRGAVIRTPAAWNYVSYSNSKGFYAGFTTLYGNVGAPDLEYQVTAIHPLTMRSASVTGYLNANNNLLTNLNFKLADKSTIPPDKAAPIIDVQLKEVPGQPLENRLISGTMAVGTELELPLYLIDQSGVNATLTVQYKSPEMIAWQSYPASLTQLGATLWAAKTSEKPAIWRYSYRADFPAEVMGSQASYFKPTLPGIYQFVVEAADTPAANSSAKTLQVRVVAPGTIPAGIDGAPVVDSITPADGSKDLTVTTPVSVWFSEPVDNVTSATFKLLDTVTGEQVPATVASSFASGRMQAVLTPRGNLVYDRKYQVVLSTAIVDVTANPVAGNTMLPLAHEYRSSFSTKAPTAYELANNQFSGGRDIALYTAPSGKTYAYITAGDQGWRVVDVSDPTTLTVVGGKSMSNANVSWAYRGVAVHPDPNIGLLAMTENIAYADGNQYGYVRFYDIKANQITPQNVGQERLAEAYSGIPGRVALYGDYAYVANANAALQVVSLPHSDPATGVYPPDTSEIVGVYDSIGEGYGSPNDIVVYAPGKAVLTTNPGYLLTLDVNNPLPVLMGLLEPSRLTAQRVAVAAEFNYFDSAGNPQVMDLALTGGAGRLKVVDLTDPFTPKVLATVRDAAGELTSFPSEISISKATGLAFVTTLNAIQVIDLKDPFHPKLLNTVPPAAGTASASGAPVTTVGTIPAVVEKNGWLYMADQNKGMRTLDFDAGLIECTKDTFKFPLERVHHLGQFATLGLGDYFTDDFKVFDVDLRPYQTDFYVDVTVIDPVSKQKQFNLITPTLLAKGRNYKVVLDYASIVEGGFNPARNPEFVVDVHFKAADGSLEFDSQYVGMVSERTEGRSTGQTVVQDVMIQDGTLNLSRQDFSFPGRGPLLNFSRSYNNASVGNWNNPLGKGWSQSLDMKLAASVSTNYGDQKSLPDWLLAGDGANPRGKFLDPSQVPAESAKTWNRVQVNGTSFRKVGDQWFAERGQHGTLTEVAGTSFVFTSKDGTKYSYGYPTETAKPAPVRKIEDRNNNALTFEYNEAGLLQRVTDQVSRSCTFQYEYLPICDQNPARLVAVNCPDPDVQLSFTYTPQGYLKTATRGPRTERYDYAKEMPAVPDSDYNLVSTTDANGRSNRYQYFGKDEVSAQVGPNLSTLKSQDVVKSITYPDGNGARFAYAALNRTVTDARGQDTVYSQNSYGNPLSIAEPLGKTTSMTWSIDEGVADNVMTSRTDPRGKVTRYEYDLLGNLKKEIDPLGNAVTTSWNQFSQPLVRTDRNGFVQSWGYDGKGNLISMTDGAGKVTSYTNLSTGERESMTDPRSNTTYYSYDQWGNLDKVTGPEGSVTDNDYDIRGRLIAVTDPNGRKTSYGYNELDYQTNIVYPTLAANGSTPRKDFSYDLMGNLLSETDRAGLTLSYTYTPRYQVQEISRSGGGLKSFDYDPNGNLIKETDWKGKETSYFYDALNRRKNTINRLNKTNILSYDLAGNLTSLQDFNGNTTSYEYDALNRRTKVVDPLLGTQLYSYYNEADPKTNLKTETDQEGNVTTYEYNGRYQLTKRTDAKLKDKTREYDDAGNLSKETDEAGHSTSFTYDRQNRLKEVVRLLNSSTKYDYDLAGNRIRTTDPRGYQTDTAYDELNRPWLVTAPADPVRYQVRTEYDNEGRDVKVTDANGIVRLKQRDTLGQVITYTDGEGKQTGFSYDLNGNVLTVSEPNGTVTGNAYDFEDRLLTVTETNGSSSRSKGVVSYDNMGNPTEVKDYNGNSTLTAYNALNLPVTTTDALGNLTRFDYFKTGKLKSVTDRRGNTTTYEYDALNRVKKVTDPSPFFTTVETDYDNVGNVASVKNKRGVLTLNTYDELNRLIRTTQDGTRLFSYEYDAAGNKTAVTDAIGNRTVFTYTPRNLLDTTTFADSTTRKRSYDGNANLKTETDELSRVASYTYDKENRQLSVEFAAETTTKEYDAVGNLTKTVKPLGNSRTMAYDGFKRLIGVTEGGLATGYAYDANGNLLTETDPLNNVTTFGYDVLNRKTSHTLADGSSTSYGYDPQGNLISTTDPKGQVATYSYDVLNRQAGAEYPGNASPFYALASTETVYDGNNNVTTVTETKRDALGVPVVDRTVNVYDNFDRLTSSTQRDLPVSYTYDANGNRTGVTSPNGSTTYSYDARNRVASATTGGATTSFDYYADGAKKTVSYPNGTTENLEYYPTKRVKGIVNKKGDTVFSSYAYLYDKNGNRSSQVELQNGLTWTTSYGYDSLDRLMNYVVAAGVTNTRTEYTYDGYNRKTEKVTANGEVWSDKVYSYNNVNRLTSVVDDVPNHNRTVTYSYDANGNTVTKNDTALAPALADTVFDYDSLNRLVQVKQGAGPEGTVAGQYDYDANNLRIRNRYSDRGDVDYLYDGHSVIEERKSTDQTLLARYSYVDKLMALATAEGSQYYHEDALGSTVNLTDPAGAVQVGYVLDPWGHIVQQHGDSVNRNVFTGKEEDANTGLVYFGQRYYDPDTARFISQDSYLGEPGTPPSLHRYLYAYSNPTVYVDLFGYASEEASAWNRLANGGKQAWEGAKQAVSQARKALPAISREVSKVTETIANQYDPDTPLTQALATAAYTTGEFIASNVLSPITAAGAVEEAVENPTKRRVAVAVLAVVPELPKGSGKLLKKLLGKESVAGEKLLTKEAKSGINVKREAANTAERDAIDGRGKWNPDSGHYETGFEAKLAKDVDYPGVSDERHFQEANRQLYTIFEEHPEYAKKMEELYPGIIDGVKPGKQGAFPRRAPTKEVTWHHNSDKEGVLELVPRQQHKAAGEVQNVLHPNGRGGMENWGGGR